LALVFAACTAPVLESRVDGEVIAFGGGPGWADDACFTCHGIKGEGDGLSPTLAGQSAGYQLKQLEDYASNWRRHKQMSAIAGRLSDDDRISVSRYYAGLASPAPGNVQLMPNAVRLFQEGDSARDIRACAECHGARGEGGLATPRLARQTPDYVRRQLSDWKRSERRNDPRDVMGAIARQLTEAEIAELARHVAAMM
jgi:cytochrome c553